MKAKAIWLIWIPVISLAISGCGQAIHSLELNSTNAPQMTAVRETPPSPLVSPSIADGAEVFSESCAGCHSKDSQNNFKDISSGWLQTNTPRQAFDLITNGVPGKEMPAFSQLSVNQRWNLIAYLFTHDFSEDEKRSAGLVYQNLCLSCHGSEGQGDGTLALSRDLSMSDWQTQPLLTNFSDSDLFSIIRNGKGGSMRAFAVMLSEAQTSALTKVVRLLSLQEGVNFTPQVGVGAENSNPDLVIFSQGFFTIEGNVVNVSGGEVTMPAEASLRVLADGQVIKKMTSPLYANGTFRFVFVPYSPEWSYVVTVSHNGMTFNSDIIYGQDTAASATANLLLKVYDSSTDVSVLRGEQTHIMLEFNGGKTLRVVEYVMISNHSSYVVVPQDEKTPLLKFNLPGAAQNLDLSNSTNASFLKVMANGFGDWQAIEPGNAHQVVFEYQLPFNGDDTLQFSFPVTATSVLVMAQDESNEVTCTGPQHLIQRKVNGGTLDIFSAVNIAAGDPLTLHCYNTSRLIPEIAGGAALLFVLVIVGLIVASKKKQNQRIRMEQAQQRRNQILDAIIVLDDSYKAGDIVKAAYLVKRAELVKQLEEDK